MAHIKIEGQIEIVDKLGSKKTVPFFNTYTNSTTEMEIYHQDVIVTASTAAVLWDINTWTGFPVATFERLFLMSDADCEVEFIVDDAGTDVISTVNLLANVPVYLGADASRDSTHTAGWAATGSAANIERITAYGGGSNGNITIVLAV